MQADRDAALSWRETFDELLVFEQDFDTAMQILMFQDEKVARLSLEDSQHTRSQRTRSRQEASIRGKTHSPSRKRQRVELDATPRPEPPPFPTPQTQEEPFTPSTTQSDGHSKQLSSGTKAGSAGDRAGSSVDVLGVGRGDGTGTGLVASLFSTGSGKQVSISKAKLDAYERQMCDDDSNVLAPSSARTDGHSKQLSSGTKAGSAGDRAGSSVDVLGVGRGDGTGTGLVASLFSTGSGKQVSISKAKLDAYERQMCDDDSNVLAPLITLTEGDALKLGAEGYCRSDRARSGARGGECCGLPGQQKRNIDERVGLGGACELPRLQVLNSITAENAIKMCFGRDGSLILSSDESYDRALFIGPRELYGQLRAGNHIVKKTGATFVWFLNHYRWIVWKLAAMERVFPRLLLAKYLTKDQVLKQMSHRYQRDVNDAQRSIVKKILQRDASSLSCMVLCIAAVLPSNSAVDQELPACWNMALVLTDGWYSVYAVPDAPLAAVLWKLHAKSSLVGTKFATWNASLQNSTEGIDPLDCAIVRESEWRNPLMADDDQTQWPYLQLRYNSTRRVRFDTRLGVEKLHFVTPVNSRHRKQQPQVSFSLLKSVPLKSLEVGGGMVRSVRVRVARISPVLHLQSKEWTLGPRILCEEQLPLYFQLRSEYAQAVMRKKHRHDDRADDWSSDDQIDVPLPIPFIKVDVECTHSSSNEDQGIGCGILTIWRPSEDLLSGGLREGVEYFASSLTVNWKLDGGRGQDAFLRLSSTKHSCFEEMHEESLANNETKDTWQTQRQRVCVDVQQGTMDYRANFEDGVNGRRNERRPKIDVCVCVVLVAARETQDASSSSTKKQVEVSLLDPAIKPQESRYFEHVFVTDQSCHLMSIRVSGMEVSMSKKKSNSPLKRSSSSSFIFRRGTKNIWKEGAILCLSGLEVSHYDEQLRVLDCVLVESTQIVSYPSKRSPFWDRFQLLQREAGISTTRNTGSQILPTSTNFAKEFTQLKKYVERDILRMDFVPSQECSEHHVEVVEQERLTQDLQAHEEGGEHATVEGVDELTKTPNHLCWDARVVKIMPLVGSNMFMFPRDVVAFACVNMGTDDTAFRTVYLTREIILSMQALLQEAGAPDGATGTNTAFVQSITDKLKEQNSDHSFRFEVRQSTNERLINSWKPWERLHASYWMAVSVAAIPTVK
ncbi:hypothetical protein PC118_g16988 [Phytophthora cactorum]|uniref:Uncharacterized protein n=1 Tax=Phytophthora cactorum TaxID=29920 RepID=A0A8T1F989_9STRA|nr:hypothetical protein PC118_g16988 [Phytophthora cactorum]